MSVFEEFLNLVVPTRCVLCRKLGSPICETCQLQKFSNHRPVSRFNLQGFAVVEYNFEIAKLIHEFKENHQTGITKAMAKPMASLLPVDCVALVPMPSKKVSFETRGFSPAKLLSGAIAREVAKNENRLVCVFDSLKLTRNVSDQAALSGHDRRNNLTGAMTIKTVPGSAKVWLVDDIVTTGATLREAARCLAEAGIGVDGFLAFAETLPKNKQKPHEK